MSPVKFKKTPIYESVFFGQELFFI